MAVQFSIAVRNARLDAVETTIGTSPKLRLYTGVQPATCALAASGTLLAEIPLPSDWLGAASAGSKTLLGTWTVNAIATGIAAHYRLTDSAGTNCHEQGTIGIGTGDLQLDNTNIANGQSVSVTTWTKTDGNA